MRLLSSSLIGFASFVLAASSTVEIVQQGTEIDLVEEQLPPQESSLEAEGIVRFPRMPAVLQSVLHEDWKTLGVDDILDQLKSPGVLEFAHGRGTFYSHLVGTYGILKAWNQPDDICKLGMTHTAYGGDLFQFFLWDSLNQRDSLQAIIGEEAEALTILFGTINRGQLGGLEYVMNGEITKMEPLAGNYTVKHRIDDTVVVPAKTAAKILMATVADYLDQMVEENGWRDHHQVEAVVDRLYPGDGRPTIAFYWFSQVLRSIRDQLDVVPAIFDSCTKTISYQDELLARDLYWNVTLHEFDLTEQQQINLLYQSISHNPYIGEPHLLLAQLYFRKKEYQQAGLHCRRALQKMYTLASAWDKRRTYAQWVGFTRILLLRINRYIQGQPHLPYYDQSNSAYDTAKGLHLTSLHDIAKEMKAFEE